MKREIRYKVQSVAIIITVSALFMGVSAQERVWSAPASLPSSTFTPLFSGEYTPSAAYLININSLDPSYPFDVEDRNTLGAGGTEGGGNPQKMPVGDGMYIVTLLTLAYGIVRRIRN
jgi:hypothetical protein